MRHIINRITGALPKWQKIGWIGCGAALAAIPLLLAALFVIALLRYPVATGGQDYQGKGKVLDRISQAAVRTPRWSPDGQSIVVNIDTAIYGVGIGGDRIWRIPHRAKGYRYSPTLAANGRVAYLRFLPRRWPWLPRQFQIAAASIDGSGAKTLADTTILTGPTPTIPTLSPDGSVIAYLIERDDADFIRLIPIDGAAASYLTLARHGSAYQKIAWSNDSKLILVSYDYPTFRLESINASNNRRKIIIESDTDQILSTAWSSDDSRIYFSQHNNTTKTFRLFSIAKNGTDQRLIFELAPRQMILNIQIPPDSNTIMFTSYYLRDPYEDENPVAPEKRVYLIDRNGANPRVIINDDVSVANQESRFTLFWTSWSPTGERIAAYNDDPNAAIVLYTMSPDGSDAKILLRRNANGDLIPGHAQPFDAPVGAAYIIPPTPPLNHRQAH